MQRKNRVLSLSIKVNKLKLYSYIFLSYIYEPLSMPCKFIIVVCSYLPMCIDSSAHQVHSGLLDGQRSTSI